MATEQEGGADRILLYRLGSIDDFVISMPALQLVRRRFPRAEIWLLTNRPVDTRAVPAMSLLNGSGLIDGSFAYAIGTCDFRSLLQIRRAIRSFNPTSWSTWCRTEAFTRWFGTGSFSAAAVCAA